MIYSLKSIPRFLKVMLNYPKAGLSFFLRYLAHIPGIERKILLDHDGRYKQKQEMRKNNKSVGHALNDRVISLSLFGKQIVAFNLKEGEEASADQFFLNRPVNDVQELLNLCRNYIDIQKNETIFDPGCGTGRHLYYLVDKYGCKGIGVDVFAPAIEVAKKANWNRNTTFYARSSLGKGVLEEIIPDGCDYVFINSWLNHVYGYDGYEEFIVKIFNSCRYILLITTYKDDLKTMLHNPEILVHDVQGSAQFALIKGNA